MKMLMILLTVISAKSFAGYAYGSGSDQDRLNQQSSPSQTEGSQRPQGSRKRGQSLFEIKGVVIGKTTKRDLENLGARPGRNSSYHHQGYDFWYNDATDNVYSIVLDQRTLHTWPETWTQVGFQQNLKYRDILGWLESSGFLTIKSSYHLEATMVSNLRVLIVKLDFNDQNNVTGVTLLSTQRLSGRD